MPEKESTSSFPYFVRVLPPEASASLPLLRVSQFLGDSLNSEKRLGFVNIAEGKTQFGDFCWLRHNILF